MEENELILDDVRYVFGNADFFKAKHHAYKLTALLKGGLKAKESNLDVDIGTLISNITDPEMEKIEAFILNYVDVYVGEERVFFKDKTQIGKHFDQYRSHYMQVIFQGVKHHFLSFLPVGVESFKNMSLQDVMIAMAQ